MGPLQLCKTIERMEECDLKSRELHHFIILLLNLKNSTCSDFKENRSRLSGPRFITIMLIFEEDLKLKVE